MKQRNTITGSLFLILYIAMAVMTSAASGSAGTGNKSIEHPQILPPEKTLRTFIQAYISRDIQTVMAYLPNGDHEAIKNWRKKYRRLSQLLMKDDRHIKSIVSIDVLEIKKSGDSKLASMTATIETTPGFTGMAVTDSRGKTTVTYRWSFSQEKKNAPWLYDGGGF